MKLLKSLPVVALLFNATTTQAQWKRVKGDGNITTTSRNTGDYDGLNAAGPMDFKLVQGAEGLITIKGDSNLMEYIITEVIDGKLVVRSKKGINLKPTKSITVTVPYQSISSVSLAGSGDIENSGTIKSGDFKVTLAGSGDIDLNVDTDSLESGIAGSGDIQLSGSTGNLKTKVEGSGDFDGSKLDSKDVEVKISGSGDVNVVCHGALNVKISGSGDVKYSGNPTSKDTNVSGSGSISN